MGSLCIFPYNCVKIYNYLKNKKLKKKQTTNILLMIQVLEIVDNDSNAAIVTVLCDVKHA